MSKMLKRFLDHAEREIKFEFEYDNDSKKKQRMQKLLNVFLDFQEYDDLSDEEFADISKTIIQLLGLYPLTSIKSLACKPDQWKKIDDGLYQSIRFPSLGWAEFENGEHVVMDADRFIYLDAERRTSMKPPVEITSFIDFVVPILFPYIPEVSKPYIFLDCIYDEAGTLIACGVIGLQKGFNSPTKIGRFVRLEEEGGVREISALEFMKMKEGR